MVWKGEADRRFRDQEMAYYTAYMSGLFSQPYAKGKFPDYAKSAPKRQGDNSRTKKQPWQTQKAMAIALNAAFGGEYQTRH